jgi:hypothetical protein
MYDAWEYTIGPPSCVNTVSSVWFPVFLGGVFLTPPEPEEPENPESKRQIERGWDRTRPDGAHLRCNPPNRAPSAVD